MANARKLLFDPNTYDPSHFDPETRRQLRAVIDWFEGRGKARLLNAEDQDWTPVYHPIVRTHPETGRKSLYLSSHIGGIVGWPVPEARAFIRDLTEHATQPQFVYSHKWRVGDLVIWDNRCTMHRGRPHDDSHPRDLRRATTLDVGSTLDEAA